ncbi:MAG TPA: ATP-binding cassette domain-containing protein [Gaiellales bacterium]
MEELLELTITAGGREHRFRDRRVVRLGRDPSNDVVIDVASISRAHATLECGPDGWVFRDAGSSYGVFQGAERVSKLLIRPGDRMSLSLGEPHGGAVVEVSVGDSRVDAMTTPVMTSFGRLSAVHRLGAARSIVIGRDPAANVVLDDDMTASRRHAEIRSGPSGWELVDLRSHNGTYLNARRVSGAEPLADNDLIGVGAALYRFRDGVLERYETSGEAWLLGIDLTSRLPNGRTILDGVSFPLAPASLMAVVGPSGAGKTTLLGALTGFQPATSGRLLYGGRDLYAARQEMRSRSGYVPQDDVLHPALRVRSALRYAARLRFAPDVDAAARDGRVDEVMAELNLTERADIRIDRLSGGQRKRVSVALELLTRPELLFLDEPTSGLDPGNEEQVMGLLRELADGGRTVVVVTHSVQSLDLCDRLLFLAAGGRTAYFGTPSDAHDFFGRRHSVDRLSQAFKMLDEDRDHDWRGEYLASQQYQSYVARPLEQAAVADALRPTRDPGRSGGGWFRQLRVLTRRYLAVIAADRRNLALMALQAPLFGLLYLGLIGQNRFSTSFGQEATMLVWLMVVGATWLGTSNSVREIVKEYPVFRRERAVGLSPSAYVVSKVVVLGPITVLQAVVMVLVAMSGEQLPAVDPSGTLAIPGDGAVLSSPLLELGADVALAGLAAMALGLLVSAVVRSSDRALVLLPVLLITQVIASVPFFEAGALVAPLGAVSSAQWGTAAAASTTTLNRVRAVDIAAGNAGRSSLFGNQTPSAPAQQQVRSAAASGRSRWIHEGATWARDAAALAVLTIAPILATMLVLLRRDRVPQGRPA